MKDLIVHPQGEIKCGALEPVSGAVAVDTFGGRIHVEWDAQAAVTPLGQLPFFTEYLKVSGLFDPWVEECPLQWTSPSAPRKRDVLGTAVLSILSGHRRYAHISALRGEDINAKLLGMSKVVSEDSVRGSLIKLDEPKGIDWLQRHLHHVYAHCSASHGCWMPMSPSNRCTVTSKGRSWATIRENRAARSTRRLGDLELKPTTFEEVTDAIPIVR